MNIKFCGECGSKIDLNASYCSECGWKVIDELDDGIVNETHSSDNNHEVTTSDYNGNQESQQSQIPHVVVNQTTNEQSFQASNYNQANNNQYNYQNNQQNNQQGYNYQYDVQNQFNQFSNEFNRNSISPKLRKTPIILSCIILAGLLIIGISAMVLFRGPEESKNMTFSENKDGVMNENKKVPIDTAAREKVGNILKDITFDRLQGEWSGTCTLVKLKNIEETPDFPPEYIQKFKDLLDVDYPCILEVDEGDLVLEIDIEEGMDLEFKDCSLSEGVITFDKSETKNGITMALQKKAYVQDDEGQLTINGDFNIKAGKAEFIYKYTVTR